MSDQPFEFDALQHAHNYRNAIIKEFGKELTGYTIEIGAGVGHTTQNLTTHPNVTMVTAIEPNHQFLNLLATTGRPNTIITGTIKNLPDHHKPDTIVSINVLEHIDADEHELGLYRDALLDTKGHLCLLVPARPEIYAPLDRSFGHFRRYTKHTLWHKLNKAGFTIKRLHYFNFIGYFAWWLTCKQMKQTKFNPSMVKIFDRYVFPIQHTCEHHLLRPPIGQSLIAIATPK